MSTPIPSDSDLAVERLRQMTAEEEVNPDLSRWDPGRMLEVLSAHTTLEAAAASVWQVKAASYAELVDVSEGTSKRNLSALHKNALTMAEYWSKFASTTVEESGAPSVRIGRIVRD
jgi:hypothetical protein